DLSEPYVLGSLWSAKDNPPVTSPTDPVDRRLIRTPKGHELEFNDQEQSVTLTTSTGHTVMLAPDSIAIKTDNGTASVTLDATGSISIEANLSIELKAPEITLSGTSIKLNGDATVEIQGGAACQIQGGIVKIN